MLPFLEPKKASTTIIAKLGKPTSIEVPNEIEGSENKIDPALKKASEDILMAIESKSVIDLAHALQSAFDICDSMPHEEGDHPMDHLGET